MVAQGRVVTHRHFARETVRICHRNLRLGQNLLHNASDMGAMAFGVAGFFIFLGDISQFQIWM